MTQTPDTTIKNKTMKVQEEIKPTGESRQIERQEPGFTPTQKATARPWTWRSFGYGLVIANHRAHIVMDFVRKGMRGAEPRFGKRSDNMGGLMVPLSEWESLPPDAEFMIAAVNSYDALREAATEALRYIKADPVLDDDGLAVIALLKSALVDTNSTEEVE